VVAAGQAREDKLGALEVSFSDEQRTRLDRASAIEPGFPYDFMAMLLVHSVVFGETRPPLRG
jgi:hypothetical protein